VLRADEHQYPWLATILDQMMQELTKEHIKRLSERFNVSPELFF
jgi:antitoxin component HigA of HigAB toxin-antitoxin module